MYVFSKPSRKESCLGLCYAASASLCLCVNLTYVLTLYQTLSICVERLRGRRWPPERHADRNTRQPASQPYALIDENVMYMCNAA